MIYDISHRTFYRYSTPVSRSHHLVHLSPREIAHQTRKRHTLLIEPAPTTSLDRLDYFGNPTTRLNLEDEHSEFIVHARSTIEVHQRSMVTLGASPLIGGLSNHLALPGGRIDLTAAQFSSPSRQTTPTAEIAAYARPIVDPDRPVLEAAWDLTRRMFTDFTFDNTVTDISTPIATVLKLRRGVCQDFAHLALACLRLARIPSRYVSGYLLTRPPEGKPRQQGADASHAWIAVWTPQFGWVDFDPTNGSMPGPGHITIAIGRDFEDVSPISGVLLGGGKHTVDVAVDVVEAG